MPELPEVETLCRQLREVIVGRRILSSRVIDPKLGLLPLLAGKRSNRSFGTASRWSGRFRAGCASSPTAHDGAFFWTENDAMPPHARLEISFRAGRLILSDPRRFATVKPWSPPLSSPVPDGLEKLDPEAPGRGGPPPPASRQVLLMDQKAITGIGNIYASEILHGAGIDPIRPAGSLAPAEWKKMASGGAHTAEGRRVPGIFDFRLADLFACHGSISFTCAFTAGRGSPARNAEARFSGSSLRGAAPSSVHNARNKWLVTCGL